MKYQMVNYDDGSWRLYEVSGNYRRERCIGSSDDSHTRLNKWSKYEPIEDQAMFPYTWITKGEAFLKCL